MDSFPVPVQSDEEEKLFGGLLTIRQMVYLLLAAISVFASSISPMPMWLKVICDLIVAVFGISLAFVRADNVTLDRYIVLTIAYYSRQRQFSRCG